MAGTAGWGAATRALRIRGRTTRHCRRGVAILWSTLLALALLALGAPAASAAPWQCDAAGYVTQFDSSGGTGGNTLFQRADRQPDGSYSLTTLGQFVGRHVNAIGFRAQDGFMYAVDVRAADILRIEQDASGAPVASSMGMPGGSLSRTPIVGAVLHDGTYAIYSPAANEGAVYDVGGASARLIARLSGTADMPTVSDWAVNPVDGRLYGAVNRGVYEIVIDTGAGTVSPGAIATTAGRVGGGQWFLPDGTLMIYDNVSSPTGVWSVNLQTGRLTQLGAAPVASNVDAASCAYGIEATKDVSPRTVDAGEEVVYTYRLVNRALSTGTVTFDDVLPAGMTYVPGGVQITPATFTPNAYGDTDTLTFSGTLPARQDVTVTARVRVSPDHGCDVAVDNTATVTLAIPGLPAVTVDSDDPTTADPGDPTTLAVTCSADLAILKEALGGPALPGEQLAYRLTVSNAGPSTARSVVVTDTLPAALSVETAPADCTVTGAQVGCAVGALAPGATRTLEIVTRVAGDATGEIANTAAVTSPTPDPNPPNNTTTTNVPVEPLADLAIVKRALSDDVVPGRNLAYELKVVNLGPSTASGVVVTDPLPRGLSFVSASDGCTFADDTVTCTLDALAADGSVTFRVVTSVASSLTGPVVNTAEVTSDTRDPDPSNNTSRAQVPSGPQADLSIRKVPSVGSVTVGQQLFYTLIVRNDGPSDAVDVTVRDVAGAGLTPLAATASQGRCAIEGRTTSCTLGTIAAGGSAQVLVSTRADATGTLVNEATVRSRTDDPDPYDNRTRSEVPSNPAPLPPDADLAIVKTASRTLVSGRQLVRYTLRVTNHGAAAATGVKVVDTPGLPMRIRSIATSQGDCARRLPVACDLGTIAAGQTVTIRIVAQPRAAGVLRNTASVTGDQPDPNPGNNLSRTRGRVRGVLAVAKTADRRVVQAGGRIAYRIRVTNRSGFALRDVRVCDRLPAGLAYVNARPRGRLARGQRCWTIDRLAAGRTRTFRVAVRALAGTAGSKVNRVTARAPGARRATARRAVVVIAGGVRAGGVVG